MTVDAIVALILFFFAFIGFMKGFLGTFLGPFFFVICLVGGLSYFFLAPQANFLSAFLIMFFGPLLLSIVFLILKILWPKRTKGVRIVSLMSRCLGAFFNLTWGAFLTAMTLLFIVMIPLNFGIFQNLKQQVMSSTSYVLTERFMKNRALSVINFENVLEASKDPQKVKAIQSTPEFQAFYQDKRIQEILSDDNARRQFEEKNIPQLLSNPKVAELLKDRELMKKVVNLSNLLAQDKIPSTDTPQDSPSPNILELNEAPDGLIDKKADTHSSSPKVYENQDGTLEVVY
ncbi:MAG: CvpA family protein [Candidatus Omnitrophota bacterium]